MDPTSWSEMVRRSREVELALGNGIKVVEDNELETILRGGFKMARFKIRIHE